MGLEKITRKIKRRVRSAAAARREPNNRETLDREIVRTTRPRPKPSKRRVHTIRIIFAVLAVLLIITLIPFGWLFMADWHITLAKRAPVPIRPLTELYRTLEHKAQVFADAVCDDQGYEKVRSRTIAAYHALFTRRFFKRLRARYANVNDQADSEIPGQFVPFCEIRRELKVQSIQMFNDRLAAVTFQGEERSAGLPLFQVFFERYGDDWYPAYSRVEAALVDLRLDFLISR